MNRLAIVSSHPIQYNAPLFKLLTERGNINIKVFYTWGKEVMENKFDPGFGKSIEWDIPLLEAYDFTFVQNTSPDPGTHRFKGIINPTLINEIETWQADAILMFGWSFQSHLKCLRYFYNKIPVLFRGDSTLLDEKRGIKQALRRLFLKWVYRHIAFAFYVGENNKDYFLAHGLKPAQLIYAPHAVDNDRFAGPEDLYEKQATELRQNIGINKDDVVILFAGKMEAKKNPFFLIDLLKNIPDKRFKILFVGSGALQPDIKSAAAKDDRILLMDFKNQQLMPAVYRLADLFILPSTGPGETWGLAINEAMASGKAVAASDKAGGAVDLIDAGINGLILDLKNNAHLEELIQSSLKDKQKLLEMGWQSQLKIQHFTFNHVATAIEDCILHKI
jgi:glycosyltransferase involved in cell wall biosynthesis